MCSILSYYRKINENLINIVKNYLLPDKNILEHKLSENIKFYKESVYPNEFLKYYYLIKLKQKFPQKHYNIINNDKTKYIIFKIDQLYQIYFTEIFGSKCFASIDNYIDTYFDTNEIKYYLTEKLSN